MIYWELKCIPQHCEAAFHKGMFPELSWLIQGGLQGDQRGSLPCSLLASQTTGPQINPPLLHLQGFLQVIKFNIHPPFIWNVQFKAITAALI